MTTSSTGPVLDRFALGSQWPTIDPFLFVAHHRDAYPAGDERLAPVASLEGRRIGMDFDDVDGWNMYHGSVVPGFPQHPHRGFETITYVRTGFIDHADSLGATARFGRGDAQWMTAGSGVVHAEMFPLLDQDGPNPLELFQIWLNLPAADKMVDPYFTMLWGENTPIHEVEGADGRAEVTVLAGRLDPAGSDPMSGQSPPPDSWAARSESDVAIWHIRLSGRASLDLPPASQPGTRRVLYVFDGTSVDVATGDPGTFGETQAGVRVDAGTGAEVVGGERLRLAVDGHDVECLLLQGRPIAEPVAQYGPFVMNDREGIVAAFDDYNRTGFGGWPWPSDDPVHERGAGRFAKHADGRVEQPT